MNQSPAIKAIAERIEARHRAQDRQTMSDDVRKVLSTKEGRRLLVAIMFQGGVYAHSKTTDNLAYMAGRRDAALEVMRDANDAASDLVLEARLERHQLILERNAEIRQAVSQAQENMKPKDQP